MMAELNSQGKLIVRDGTAWLRWLFLPGFAIGIFLLFLAFVEYQKSHPNQSILIGAGCNGLLGTLFCWHFGKTAQWVFDPTKRTMNWRRQSLFSSSSGCVAFEDIVTANIQMETITRNTVDTGRYEKIYRIALVTNTGDMLLTEGYGLTKSEADTVFLQISASLGKL